MAYPSWAGAASSIHSWIRSSGTGRVEVARHLVVGELEAARLGELAVAVVLAVVERQVRGRHQDAPAVGPGEPLDVLDQRAAHAAPPLADVHVDDGPRLLGVVEEEGEQDGGADHPVTVVGREELRPLATVRGPDRAQELLEVPVRGVRPAVQSGTPSRS